MVLLIILVVLLAYFAGASLYRLVMLRRGGTAALVRTLPNGAGHGWRHGLIRYGEGALVFFKLSSLRLGPDSRLHRSSIVVVERRSPEGSEHDLMTDEVAIIEVRDADGSYEIGLDRGALTAFLSWVESRPSGRSLRGRRR
ncbi:DUF2550 domain-containing protein [Aldersonia sp. NBC_00410]|jgi:hypothetical protein|uniref:DUF2550 domain-containing protein n=1 Tax=Aldersonia sp. NBC_00410 TaxID=2975954 RepID=UPI00225BC36C|nr:DUF2550 domain-containing protein [Aldersonia sp. NBC_00410]MCX5043541.1 DUF2550 domain-containing protein [Aldersonia sp. NBC_00410]